MVLIAKCRVSTAEVVIGNLLGIGGVKASKSSVSKLQAEESKRLSPAGFQERNYADYQRFKKRVNRPLLSNRLVGKASSNRDVLTDLGDAAII